MEDFPFPISEDLSIVFSEADIDFQLSNSDQISNWLENIIDSEKGSVSELSYIFCSDAYLHNLNMEYLNHDTLTDIITFPINNNPIQSDIFISIDRVRENATDRNISFENELKRVIVHGLLHLLGYKDKSVSEKETMRTKENFYLQEIR